MTSMPALTQSNPIAGGPQGAMRPLSPAAKAAATKHAAQDFESFFITSMLESMSAGLKPDKLFGGGAGESMYRSLMNQEYGKAIAAHGSLGLTDSIEREMLRMQEKASS